MRVRESTLEIGDRVLVRNLRLRNKHKLADRWESTVYVVQKGAGDLPVYTICPEGQDRPICTLHWDLLLPCGFLCEVEEEPVKPTPATKPRMRQTPIQPDERSLHSDEEDDESPSFYPLEMTETEARVLESFSVPPSQNVIATESETCTQTKLSHELGNLPVNIPEMEPGNFPVNLPEPSAADVLNLPVGEENTNLTGHLPYLEPNISEPVEKYPVEQEPDKNNCVETEKDDDQIEMQNHTTELEQTTEIETSSPDTSLPETERDEQLTEREQKQSKLSNNSSQEQTDTVVADDDQWLQDAQTGREVYTPLPRSFDLADTSPKDNSQPATARDHVSVERTDSAVSEQDRDPILYVGLSVREEHLESSRTPNLEILLFLLLKPYWRDLIEL